MIQMDERRQELRMRWRQRAKEEEGKKACFLFLFPSRTDAGRHRPRGCDFEVVSLIKELIKGKLHASEEITEKRKGAGREGKEEQIWSREAILAAHQFLKCRPFDWQRSQLAHRG